MKGEAAVREDEEREEKKKKTEKKINHVPRRLRASGSSGTEA